MTQYKLFIFDIDGTIADRDSGKLLPGVTAWFEAHPQTAVAFATNQGGVGLRYWMESNGFGEPERYPTEKAIWEKIDHVAHQLPGGREVPIYVCFAYQSQKSGNWSPIPPYAVWEDGRVLDTWGKGNRKPAPGMLLQAMQEANVAPVDTVMVGDMESDKEAAQNAGCAFIWADKFFGRTHEQDAQ